MDIAPIISSVAGSVGAALGLSPGVIQLLALVLGLLVPVVLRYVEKRGLVSKDVAAVIVQGVENATTSKDPVRSSVHNEATKAGLADEVKTFVDSVIQDKGKK